MRSGYIIRIIREGEWKKIDMAEMTDAEVERFFESVPIKEHKKWAKIMLKVIKEAKGTPRKRK